MDESLQAQIETYLSYLDGLIRRGRQLRDRLATDPSNSSVIAATRVWQEDCGVTVNQLSGGSKAHWLARSFSQAFLVRSAAGHAVEGADPAEIVQRLLDVLEQAVPRSPGWRRARALLDHRLHLRRRRRLAGSSSFTTPSSGRLSSRPTPIAGALSSKGTMTCRCALLAESWRPS